MNNNNDKVMEIFFDNPTAKFHIREVARITGLNPNTVSSAIKIAKNEKLVRIEKKRHIVEVSANISSKEFIRKKREHNFSEIYDSGLIDFLEDFFSKNSITVDSISVIGSFSQGEDIEKSDVDIIVIARHKPKEMPDLAKYENKLKRKIHLIITDYNNVSEEFFNNLINGMLLYGYLRKK